MIDNHSFLLESAISHICVSVYVLDLSVDRDTHPGNAKGGGDDSYARPAEGFRRCYGHIRQPIR
jgi:hypothetical protein